MSICDHTVVDILPNRPPFPMGVRNYDSNPGEYRLFKLFFEIVVLKELKLPSTLDPEKVRWDINTMFLACLIVDPEMILSKEETAAISISKKYEKKTVTYLGYSGLAIFFLLACAVALANGVAYYNGVKPVSSLTLEQATTLVIVSGLILTFVNSYAGLWITGILPDKVSKYENKEQNAIDEFSFKKTKSIAYVMLDAYASSDPMQKNLALFFAKNIQFDQVLKKLAASSTQEDKIRTALDPLQEVCALIQIAEEEKEPDIRTDWVIIAEKMGIVFGKKEHGHVLAGAASA